MPILPERAAQGLERDSSRKNTGYQDSLARAEHRALGSTVDVVWTKLLRTPDRYVHVDPKVFLDPSVTSDEYVRPLLPHGRQSLR
jgi:hypothetical protein